MYKVLLADDNELSRRAVKNSVLWKNSSCKIIGEADNGKSAYEMIRDLRPEIALLDIKMPGMTGLEVVRRLAQEGIECLCILITAYDDFTFAREGLKLGVFDYLLKPVAEEELQEVIKKAVGKLSEQMETSARRIRRKLLAEAARGYEASSAELFQMLQEEGRCREYCLMLVSWSKPAAKDSAYGGDGIPESLTEELLAGFRKRYRTAFVFYPDREGVVILLVFREMLLARDYDLTALKCANYLVREMKARGFAVTVSISETGRKPEELENLYRHTVFAHDSRFFLENQDVIHYDSLRSRSFHNEYEMMEYLENFYSVCREKPRHMEESLARFLELLGKDESYDVTYVRGILIQTAIMMTCLVREKGMGEWTWKSVNEIMDELSACSTVQEAFEWLTDYARALGGTYQDGRRISPQSRRILDYLNQHYMNHITLQDASEQLQLSGTHICRLLKNDTGETFVTLLNKIRIQAAIRMLREGNLKVYEVAERTGFRNYAYFYQLFKKETGCSPTEFK